MPDPLQLPYLIITSDNYVQKCFMPHAEFSSACLVPADQLKSGREVKFTISCSVECHLLIRVYLSKVITIELGKEISLTAVEDAGLVTIISIHIPQNEAYSSLRLTAFITNLEESISLPKLDL